MNLEYIKNFVLESDLISDNQKKKTEELSFEKNINFVDALLELNFLDQSIVLKISNNIIGIPKIDLKNKVISLDCLKIIPKPLAQKHNLICFFVNQDSVFVAFSDRNSLKILEKIIPQNKKLKLFLADEEDIKEKNKKYSELISEELLFKCQNNLKKILRIDSFGIKSEKDLPQNFREDIANDLYTEKFINNLLGYAINNKADFIFFDLCDDKIAISLRIIDRNYEIMTIDKNILFSISTKLKYFSDINIFKKFTIKQSSFFFDFLGVSHNIFLTFVKTDFGETIIIQIDKDKKFKTDIGAMIKKQRKIILSHQRKDSGFLILSGQEENEIKKTLYSFVEFDVEKRKNIFLLEENPLNSLDYVKQISISKKEKILLLVSKIIENYPDVLALEKISKGLFPILFNYVSFSKKIFLSTKLEAGILIELLLDMNFDKGYIVKNFSLFMEHQIFKELNSENRKKHFLSKEEIKILTSFISEKEILENLKNENLKNISKIEFFTKMIKRKKSFFSFKKQGNIFSEEICIKGVLNLGLFLENCFLKRYLKEKIKNVFRKEIKKKILENALLAAHRGQIDIKEVLKYLTK